MLSIWAAERTLLVPATNTEEACLASGLRVNAVNHLLELVAHFNGNTPKPPYQSSGLLHQPKPYLNLSEIQGLTAAKRALVVAHGKTMLTVAAWMSTKHWR